MELPTFEDIVYKSVEVGTNVVSKALHVGQFVLTRVRGGAWAELSDPFEPEIKIGEQE